MNGLEFVAALIEALAWPAAAIVILLVLRRPLLSLLPNLERMKLKDIEFEFAKRVREVSEKVTSAAPGKPLPTDEAALRDIADVSPRAAVIESWLRVEQAATRAAKAKGVDITSSDLKSPMRLTLTLADEGVVTKDQAALLQELRVIRNAAAHASSLTISPSTAQEYAETALQLASSLERTGD